MLIVRNLVVIQAKKSRLLNTFAAINLQALESQYGMRRRKGG